MEPQTTGAGAREELRKWRLETPLDTFANVRKQWNDAGIELYAYNLSFNNSFSDAEIDRGFEMAKAMGVKVLTASLHGQRREKSGAVRRQAQDSGGHARP